MAAAGSLAKEFCEEMVCPVCLEYFTDPVITECGHNFCRACLAKCQGELEGNFSCPECRETIQQNNLRPNRKLANIVEISKKSSFQEAKGTGCTERVCEKHQEALKLFCRDDEAPICVVCDKSKEHREHQVIPTGEAAEEYKEKIQAQIPTLEQKRQKLVELKLAEEQRNQECLKQFEEQNQKITSVFKEMHRFLKEKERFWLLELAGLKKEIKRQQEENLARLSQEISHFSDLIKAAEVKCQQPLIEFLQDIRCTLSRCQEGQDRQQLELSPGLEWRHRCPNITVLEKAMEEFEGSKPQGPKTGTNLQGTICREESDQSDYWTGARPLEVSVTLDPKTAYPRLILSKDLKSVRRGNTYLNLPNNPERFDWESFVLGRERFTSGRYFWEVEVERFSRWDTWAVGVARESLRRKGNFYISPNEGIWAVGKDSTQQHPFSVFTSNGEVPLNFIRQPRKVRVLLDYKEGCVQFFDANTNNLIFTFPPASFSGEGIKPFFWVRHGVCLYC